LARGKISTMKIFDQRCFQSMVLLGQGHVKLASLLLGASRYYHPDALKAVGESTFILTILHPAQRVAELLITPKWYFLTDQNVCMDK